VRLSLTGERVVAWTNLRTVLLSICSGHVMHHSSDKYLACGDEANLDCCEVMAITGDFDMTIITLDSHYSVLSCLPTPPDVLSVPYK
jgi:hypothetical protein